MPNSVAIRLSFLLGKETEVEARARLPHRLGESFERKAGNSRAHGSGVKLFSATFSGVCLMLIAARASGKL